MKTRKGFTLVELLVVIAIMGTLGAMAMIGGQQATDAAKAANIADSMEKAAIAMMGYYSDNNETIDKEGTTIAKVVAGANAYLKGTPLTAGTATAASTTPGAYSVVVTTEGTAGTVNATAAAAKWYLCYTLLDTEKTNGNIAGILANKANRMQLYGLPTGSTELTALTAYDGTTDTVYMLVR